MAYASGEILFDPTTKKVTVNPKRIEIAKNHSGIKWTSDYEFEVEIKGDSGEHFKMGKKSGRNKLEFKTKIRKRNRETKTELTGKYSARVFVDGEEYELDPDYIIRPRG